MKPFADALGRQMAKDPRLVVVEADLGRSSGTSALRELFPSRYVNTGIAEQHAVGLACGLALTGWHPVVHTFAAFASMRSCEQIRTGAAYGELPVVICASKGGFGASASGPTHHATEDLAIIRSMPNTTVATPGTWEEVEEHLASAVGRSGPTYIRLPVSTTASDDTSPLGADVVIVALPAMMQTANEAKRILQTNGIPCGAVRANYIKPLDSKVRDAIKSASVIVTIEDHSIIGGLGSAVLESDERPHTSVVLRFGVKDRFCAVAGEMQELLDRFVGSPEEIASAASTSWLSSHSRESKVHA